MGVPFRRRRFFRALAREERRGEEDGLWPVVFPSCQVLAFASAASGGGAGGKKKPKEEGGFRKQLIVMDEVDGMGGSDRGGIQELIGLIKKSKVPIIAICNDRQHPKIRCGL